MPRPMIVLWLGMGCLAMSPCSAQQTPPIEPKTQQTPLPPPIEVPAPANLSNEVPNRPLSVEEAVKIALRKQPNVAIARAGLTAAQGRTQQARAGMMPTVALGGGYTRVESLNSTAGSGTGGTTGGVASGSSVTVPGFQATLNLRQLLFDFNHVRDLVRQGNALERSALANLTKVQADLALQIKQAYYTAVLNVRLVGVNETNVQNRQTQLTLAEARLRSGLGLPSDVVRAQTAVAEAIQNLTVARNNDGIARINLALFMGIDPRTPLSLEERSERPLAADSLEALVSFGLKQRPELQQAQANLQASHLGVRAAKTNSSPNIAATLGFTARGNSFPPNSDFVSIGVAIQWNAFDGNLTAGRIKEAKANVETALAQQEAAQLSVISDVSQAYLNLKTAEQRVKTADVEVANAEEGVRISEGRYRSGIGTFLDVLDSQSALLTARTNRVNALSAVDQAHSALAHAIGSPLPKLP